MHHHADFLIRDQYKSEDYFRRIVKLSNTNYALSDK
jgi:hypothetical protein